MAQWNPMHRDVPEDYGPADATDDYLPDGQMEEEEEETREIEKEKQEQKR